MPYLKHILTLWLYSSSLIGVNFFTLLDKSYKKTTKNFQSILKTDSKLSAFFHRFRLFLFPSESTEYNGWASPSVIFTLTDTILDHIKKSSYTISKGKFFQDDHSKIE